jgi:hypothetical protein
MENIGNIEDKNSYTRSISLTKINKSVLITSEEIDNRKSEKEKSKLEAPEI